jgi:RimJ/RimL family protein N-acetyltransferase
MTELTARSNQPGEGSLAMPTLLHTERLKLVAPDVALAEKLAEALTASFELHREFLVWSKPHWTLEDARESLQSAVVGFSSPTEEKRYFVLEQGEREALVGCIGLTPQIGVIDGFEIGYWVNHSHAGKGLMKEALAALIGELEGRTFYLTTSSANQASQRLAQSVGLRCTEVIKGAHTSQALNVCDTLVYKTSR